ncbi:MAG: hypothetical protein CVT80_00255 [Alphaproteobacteria bacterium HGW-Alphaproteobacteria-2]|nr:MAG: hypothetical protein CVT80_00255 [Alphaproteobacteria bacterium HGW-Alphaproteobacteria-2]
MMVIVHSIAEGRPLRLLRLRDAAEAALNTGPGEAWIEGTADLARDMVQGGLVVPRPDVPPLPAGGPAPFAVPLDGLPSGSAVRVQNEEGEALEITDMTEPLTLIDAGVYLVEVSPPWPWLPVAADVEVSDA